MLKIVKLKSNSLVCRMTCSCSSSYLRQPHWNWKIF